MSQKARRRVTRDAGGGGRRLFFVFFNFLLPNVSFISRENIRAEGMLEGLQHAHHHHKHDGHPATLLRTRLPTTLPAPLLLRGTSAEHALSPRLCTGSRCAIGHPRLRRQPLMASGCWSVVQPIVVRKREDKPCNFVCNKTMSFKNALFAALVSLFLLAPTCRAEGDEHEHEDEHHEESKTFEANPVWGYSFLFNFLGCLPSACAIVVCLWAKFTIADKVITNLMAFASGVSAAC